MYVWNIWQCLFHKAFKNKKIMISETLAISHILAVKKKIGKSFIHCVFECVPLQKVAKVKFPIELPLPTQT